LCDRKILGLIYLAKLNNLAESAHRQALPRS
jgi:hypothetical protein